MWRCDRCVIFSQACENGRGAILLSVARGKVSEGIDFGESFFLQNSVRVGVIILNICQVMQLSVLYF